MFKNVIGSKLDYYSYIVSKLSEGKKVPLNNDEIVALRDNFKHVSP